VGLDRALPGWPLAGFRIVFGLLYLDMALQKAPWLRDDAGRPFGWLPGFLEQEIAHPAFTWYALWLRDVVVPNLALFGLLTFVTELALGLGLVLGFLTRLVGFGGVLWQLNIALGAYRVPGEWYWIWPLLALPQLCFALSGAGRVLGLDLWLEPVLHRRATQGATWARLVRHAT
jgi:hypothetical protein